MRRIILFFVISVFLLAACQSGLATIPVSTTAATLALSAPPTLTETPALPTLTPLPTISTFTPTFDARTIAAAIAYADTHPEILIPLGSDYHGWQSHIYFPADVCPFR